MAFLDVPTPDGRVLEVLAGGDPDGFPWLFHSGSPSAAVAFAPIEDAARAQGLRLVTYSRPGYGGSSPRLPAQGDPRMADDVVDSATILDHLGIDEFVTLGWSGGGPRALACGALLPDRCRAVASMAGAAPRDGLGLAWFAGMAPENVAEYTAAAAGAAAYEEYLVQEFLPILQATPDDLAAAMGELFTPVDLAALTPAFAAWLAAQFHRAGAGGVVGVRDDGLAAVSPWGFELTEIRVPVAIWQGRQDAMVPFAHGQWLAAHVPGARAHLLEGEGHLSLVGKLDEILADLVELSRVG